MKKFFTIIHKPKHIAAISMTLAAIIAVLGLFLINRAPAYQFAQAQAGEIESVWTGASSTSATGADLTLSFQATGEIQSVSVKAGDTVTQGEVLATLDPQNTAGALTQAKAAYDSAVANYDKLVNGATTADVAVTNATLLSAQTAFAHDEQTLSQTLSDSFTAGENAVRNDTDAFFNNPETTAPTLSTAGMNFSNQTLEYQIQNERAELNAMFPFWQAEIASTTSASDLTALAGDAQNHLQAIASYLADLNSLFTTYSSAGSDSSALDADQSAIVAAQNLITGQISSLTNTVQAVSSASANVAESQANLTLKTSSARPEDIAAAEAEVSSAQGAMQIAEAAYDNRVITAPGNGMVSAVYISVGQIASADAPAIDITGATFSKNVAIMIPNNAIIDNSGTFFVLVKSGNTTMQKEITTGVSDATNTEVLSGITAGDEVAILK